MSHSRPFFDEYVRDRREQSIELYTLEDLGYLVRYTPQTESDGIVMFANLKPSEAKSIIEEQINYFGSKCNGFEWKVYDFDEPGNLKSLLGEYGFLPDEPEAFMACSVKACVHSASPLVSWEIVQVESKQGLLDVVSVQESVWDRKFDWLAEQLQFRVTTQPEQLSIYCAYVDGKPVGTGWTDFPKGSKFPELHGGSVLPEMRGQGIYKALYEKRLAEAANRGYEWLVVDASPMSRPILEKMGFIHICSTTPMCYKFA